MTRSSLPLVGLCATLSAATPAWADSRQDALAQALSICAPFVEDGAGLPPQAGEVATGDLRDAFMARYAYDPATALRAVKDAPFVVITAGVQGCWLVGRHDGNKGVVSAARDLARDSANLQLVDSFDHGVSMDGLNAEAGVTMRLTNIGPSPLKVTVLTFGPANAGYYEVNVQNE